MAILTLFRHRFWDNSGLPLAGGKVYTYAAGTTTPTSTFTDSTGSIANTNPITLDSKGEAGIWTTGLIKVNVTDSVGVQITGWPVDNIGIGVNSSVQMGSVVTSGLTVNTGKILGRTTAAVGAIEEIAIGAGLSMAAGVLSNPGTTTSGAEQYADATGTSDVILASYPTASITLTDGFRLAVHVTSQNTTPTPTFAPTTGGTLQTARTIVKFVNNVEVALLAGDIQGIIDLRYDLPNLKWVLMNPFVLGAGFGFGQILTDVTASRLPDVIYTNTTGKQIFVMISVLAGPGSYSIFYVNSIQVGECGASSPYQIRTSISFMVPIGSTYTATSMTSAVTIEKWAEIR